MLVYDPTGSAIADAALIIRHKASGANRSGRTDGQGAFTFSQLRIGEYSLHVEKEGFSGVDASSVSVSLGQVVVQRLSLPLATVAGRLEVNESVGSVEIAATSSSAALGSDRIEEAPSKGRNYFSFVALAPGVVPSPQAGAQKSMAGIRNPLADSGFSFSGMRGRNNSINIDGVDNRDETTGGNRVAIGLEMVEEFRVGGLSVGAELGGAAGGLVNMVTRSGTNLWHGDATFFYQNGAIGARKPEVPAGQLNRLNRYQPGVSINGPIKRDKTFFSTALEAEWESEQEWSETPPDAVARIKSLLNSSTFAKGIVKTPLSGLFNTATRGTQFSLKMNHLKDEHNTFAGRYAYSRGRVLGDVQGSDNFLDQSSNGSSRTTDHSGVLSWLRVFSPSVVNDIRGQISRREQSLRPNAYGPLYEVPGVISIGQGARLYADRTENHFELVENLNLVFGKHRLSLGLSAQTIRLNARMANRAAGIFVFPTLNALLSASPDLYIQAFGNPAVEMNTVPVGMWFQDRIQVRSGLLIEAGVRVDKQSMPSGFPASPTNVSPRVGLAWQPDPSRQFVIRAGAGLFFDRYPLAYLNEAAWKNGSSGFEQYAFGSAATQVFRQLNAGTALAPITGLANTTYTPSSYFPSTYSRKVGLGFEYGIDKDTKVTVEASQVQGVHLPRMRNISSTTVPSFLLDQTAKSSYHGASFSVNHRMRNELAFLASYDLGGVHDDGSDFDEQAQDPRNIRADWAKSRIYQLHRVAASALFEIPNDGIPYVPVWLRESLERITIAPIFTFMSGRPVNSLLTFDAYRTGAYPLSARPAGVGRNPSFSPATTSFDIRVMKTFMTHHDRAKLQFGVEAFNLLNHSNIVSVSPYSNDGVKALTSYRGAVESANRRQFQMLVQWEY